MIFEKLTIFNYVFYLERIYTQWSTEQEELLEEMFGKCIRDKNLGWLSELNRIIFFTKLNAKALPLKKPTVNKRSLVWTHDFTKKLSIYMYMYIN